MSAFWSGHVGAAAGSCLGMLLSEWCLRFGRGMLVPLQGVLLQGVGWGAACAFLERACWCRCRVLLAGAAIKVVCGLWSAGACKVRLQGAAVGVVCALWRWLAVAAAGCHCRVLLQGAAVKVSCALWTWPAGGAAAGCCFRVLLQGAIRTACALWSCLLVPVRVLLQGAASPWCSEWRVRFGAGGT